MVDIIDLGTISDVLFYLERQGLSPDDAKQIITRVFCWGVNAATMRHEFSATPADAPPIKPRVAQLALVDEAPPARKEKKDPAKLSRTWPVDFKLTDHLITFATERGFSQAEIQRQWERFRDRNQARGEKYANWDAAWRTWVNNQVEFKNRDANARKADQIDGRL